MRTGAEAAASSVSKDTVVLLASLRSALLASVAMAKARGAGGRTGAPKIGVRLPDLPFLVRPLELPLADDGRAGRWAGSGFKRKKAAGPAYGQYAIWRTCWILYNHFHS